MKRRPAGRGLSYYDANKNRLVTEGPDVLAIKAEIESRWSDISTFFDLDEDEWVIVEHCKDGTDRVAFTTTRLSQATIDKIARIDQAAHVQGDVALKVEREADKAEADKDHALSEQMGEPLERLYHALRKDGVIHRPQVFFL